MNGNLIYWCKKSKESLTRLNLTVWSKEDPVVLHESGLAELRRHRVQRLIDEAESQGARLSYKDLSLILLTSKATLKRDMKDLKTNKAADIIS